MAKRAQPKRDPWVDVDAGPSNRGAKAGPAKLRIAMIGGKPMGILSKAAVDHLAEHGCAWVRVQRGGTWDPTRRTWVGDPRAVRLLGLTAAEPGALKIRTGSLTISGARLLRLAPPGTDILLEPKGPALVGRIPDGVEVPAVPDTAA